MLQRLRKGTLTWLTGEGETGDSKEGVQLSNLGKYAGLSAAKYSFRAGQTASLPVSPFPHPSFQYHRCFHSHPYSPNLNFGKNHQPQTHKGTTVCIISFISTSNIHIFPNSSSYLGLTSRSFP